MCLYFHSNWHFSNSDLNIFKLFYWENASRKCWNGQGLMFTIRFTENDFWYDHSMYHSQIKLPRIVQLTCHLNHIAPNLGSSPLRQWAHVEVAFCLFFLFAFFVTWPRQLIRANAWTSDTPHQDHPDRFQENFSDSPLPWKVNVWVVNQGLWITLSLDHPLTPV